MKVAIIGAGLSGLMAGNALKDRGADVTVFDKGRNVGGRCATRPTDYGFIDHGLQFLDGHDARIISALERFECDTAAISFTPGGYSPVPQPGPFLAPLNGARSFAEAMSAGLNVRASHTVSQIRESNGGWDIVTNQATYESFNAVILAIPPQQAAAFNLHGNDLALDRATYTPQVAALIGSNQPLNFTETGPLTQDGLAWISKSADGKRATILTSEPLSSALMDTDKDEIAALLWERIGGGVRPEYLQGHRWRYCRVDQPLGQPCYLDDARMLGYCGDWFIGPNAGDALESGAAVASRAADALSL